MRSKLIRLAPNKIISFLKKVRNYIRTIFYKGNKRYCPVCNNSSKRFVKYRSRKEAVCAYCLSLERHRFAWLYLNKEKNLLTEDLKLLHIAPEPELRKLFRSKINKGYLTADLYDPDVIVKMDIMHIQYPDEYFDAVFCSHVLEHVYDDRKAMKEMFRVLRKNGWAIFMVPVNSEVTIEDPDVVDPAERLRLFGQEDHVRSYGPDFFQRLEESGFKVQVISPNDFLSHEEMIRMGVIDCTGDIFFCRK